MKVQYTEIEIQLVMFSAEDVLTLSGDFDGSDHKFTPPTPGQTTNFG